METTDRKGQSAGIVGGVILVVVGGLFLLQQTIGLPIWSIYWPFYVIIPGLFCLGMAALGGEGAGWLAIPGMIVSTVGAILLIQDLTGRYETWAYAWALVSPFAVGVGILLAGLREGQPSKIESGKGLAMSGLVLFLVFGAIFELLIFGERAAAGVIWPIVLIIVGLGLLLGRRRWPARR